MKSSNDNDSTPTYYEYTENDLKDVDINHQQNLQLKSEKSLENEKKVLRLLNKNGISIYTDKKDKLNSILNVTSLKYNTFDNIINNISIIPTLLRSKDDEIGLQSMIDDFLKKNNFLRKKIDNFKIIKGSDEYIVEFPLKDLDVKEIPCLYYTVKNGSNELIEFSSFEKQENNSVKKFIKESLSIKLSNKGEILKINFFDENRKLIHCFDIQSINNTGFNEEDKKYITDVSNFSKLQFMIGLIVTIKTYYLNDRQLDKGISYAIMYDLNNFLDKIYNTVEYNTTDTMNFEKQKESVIKEQCNNSSSTEQIYKNQNFAQKITLNNALNRGFKYSIKEKDRKTGYYDANGELIKTKLNGYIKSDSWLGNCCRCIKDDEAYDWYKQENINNDPNNISMIEQGKNKENQEIIDFLNDNYTNKNPKIINNKENKEIKINDSLSDFD